MIVTAAFICVCWIVVGPGHPVFPWLVGFGSFGLLGIVRTPRCSFAPAWALPLGTLFGVRHVSRILDAVGWNASLGRVTRDIRNPENVHTVRDQASSSSGAHAVGAVLCTLTAIASGSVLLFVLGALLHAYPVVMQWYVLAKLRR